MAKIQGITIELGADASGIEKALKDVDKASTKTSKELSQINRALKFDEGNTTLLKQKFDVLQDSIKQTSTRLDALKEAQKEVDAQFASGKIDGTQYRAFIREIERTQGKLDYFKNQADDVKAKIEVKADTSALNKLKSEIKSLPDDAKQASREIGQNLAAGAATAAAGMTALTVGMSDTNKQLSRLESQAANATSAVDKLGANTKKMSDADLAKFQESLSIKEGELEKGLDAQLSAIEKNYDKQGRELDKALDNEMRALEKSHDRKLELIDEEYKERLKLIDEEEYNRLKAIDNQIDAIEAEQDAIDKANKLAEEQAKRQELQFNVGAARGIKEREKAEKALADFESRVADERAKEERKTLIDGLKEQKDVIKEQYDERRDQVEEEKDLRIKQVNESFEIEKQSLSDLQELKREKFEEQKELYLSTVREQYATELEEFKKMNAQKLKEAEKPIVVPVQAELQSANLTVDDFKDSRVIFDSVRQDVDQVSEAIGNLTQAGYDSGQEITAVSKSIAGAIQLYGDTFNAEGLAESIATTTNLGEVTGQLTDLLEKNGMTAEQFNAQLQQYSTVGERANYVAETLAKFGLTDVYNGFAESNQAIVEASEAQVEFTDAMSDFTTAIQPLLTEVQKLLALLLQWLADNPALAKSLLVLTTVIGAIGGAVAVLGPVISGAIQIFNVLSKVLPIVGRAFAGLSGPIGWVILILTTVVPLIIANWETLASFFTTLWEGIKSVFTTVITTIIDFVTENWQLVVGLLTGPFGLAIALITENWDKIKEVFSTAIESVKKIITNVWDGIVDLLIEPATSAVDGIIKAFESIPEKIKNIFLGIVELIKTPFNYVISLINDFLKNIGKIKIPNWVPFAGGKKFEIPQIPMLAKGTDYFRGGMALVGEQGPELVRMPTGARVTPNNETMNMLGQPSEIIVPVTLQIDGRVLAQTTARYTSQEIQRQNELTFRGRI